MRLGFAMSVCWIGVDGVRVAETVHANLSRLSSSSKRVGIAAPTAMTVPLRRNVGVWAHNAKTSYFYTPHDGEGPESRRSPRPRDLVCEQSDEFIGLLGATGSTRA